MSPRAISATRLVPMLGAALETAPAYRGLADAVRLLVAVRRQTTSDDRGRVGHSGGPFRTGST